MEFLLISDLLLDRYYPLCVDKVKRNSVVNKVTIFEQCVINIES